jgi:TonB-dependent receptor
MQYLNRKRLTIAIMLQCLATAAVAQNNLLEEVTVTASPIRDSALASIEAKRNANNYMDAISADTIGRFPDQNLADSLGRLPGLAIERDQGQARYINLRGAPFRYTTIAFDSINVPGAEGGRVPRFDSFPAVITSRIEANKAILPSMPGESVAGFINVHTYSPFDRNGFGLSTDIGMGEQDLGGGDVSKYSLRGSWSGESVGVMAFGSKNEREQVTDNREYDLSRNASGQLIVNELDFRSYIVERSDQAWGANLEFQGDGALQSLYARTLYSEFVDLEQRNQYVFAFATPQQGLTGSGANVAVTRALEFGEYKNSTFTNTLGAEFDLDTWQAQVRFNRTDTEFLMDLPIPQSIRGSAVARYDLTNIEDPILSLDRAPADAAFLTTIGIHYVQALDVTTDKFKLDLQHDFNWLDQPAVLEVGGQIDTRKGTGYVATPGVGGFPRTVDINAFDTGRLWNSNTTNSIGGTYYDNIGLRDAWAASGQLTWPTISAANQVSIDEDIDAVYAMVTTTFDWGNVVLGARYERTDYTSRGTSLEGPVEASGTFNNFLPSAHLNIDLADDLKLRFSASSGLSRPTYNEWRAAASLDVTNKQVRGGNPTLQPEKSHGFDTSLEWYFAPAAILSAGAFYRAIDKVIYADSSPIDGGVYLPSAAGQSWTYTGSVNGDDGEMRGLELNLTTTFEDWLPAPFDGLGVTGNLTALDTEFRGIDGVTYDLPGTSDMIYNASLFYEKFGASIRLNYQWRDQWISPIEDPSEYWGEQQRVDLTASYTLPMDIGGTSVSFYLNANNLTDETDNRYAGNGTINQSESYGRYWLMGIRVNY